MIRLCDPQRQILPSSASATSRRDGEGLRSSRAFAAIRIPARQYPHCPACSSRNACCKGCGRSGVPSPSIVRIFLPATVDSALPQDFSGRPSTSTMQQPHCSRPQPNLVPTRPRWLRSTSNSGVSPSAPRLTALPFTVRSIAGIPRPPKPARPCSTCFYRKLSGARTKLATVQPAPSTKGHGLTIDSEFGDFTVGVRRLLAPRVQDVRDFEADRPGHDVDQADRRADRDLLGCIPGPVIVSRERIAWQVQLSHCRENQPRGEDHPQDGRFCRGPHNLRTLAMALRLRTD